jgi:short-subunit dehydrogenase
MDCLFAAGRIVNVTSHCAHTALPGLGVYCATKAGLRAWSDSLRVEMKKFQVPVVQIVPGMLVSDHHQKLQSTELNIET